MKIVTLSHPEGYAFDWRAESAWHAVQAASRATGVPTHCFAVLALRKAVR